MRELSPGRLAGQPVMIPGPTGDRAAARPALVAVALASIISSSVNPLAAQNARLTGITVARYIELRPVVTDSVPRSAVIDSIGQLYQTSDGLIVGCQPLRAFCTYVRSDDPVATLPLTQDLQASAWGLGEGVSAYAHLRIRTALGDSRSARDLWPRADDELDPLAVYVDVDRSRFRARVGRQWVTSGLGLYNFDGASVIVRPWRGVSIDAYGGWSLARGLNEPHTGSAIAAVEDIVPDERAYLLGAELRVRPERWWAAGALYQREIMTSREALYSERVALDGHLLFPRGGLDAQLEGDLASGALTELWLRGNVLVSPSLTLRGELRRYEPFFELWTIWGAFDPVGFDEARAAVYWEPRESFSAGVSGGYRRYEETNAGLQFLALRDDGWRVATDLAWRSSSRWLAHGSVGVDVGFGATRSDADVGARWQGGRLDIGVRASAFQRVFEFRVGTGRVIGVGVDAAMRLRDDLRLMADLAAYNHSDRDGDSGAPQAPDWSQLRGALRLSWTVGRDPGDSVQPPRRPDGSR